MAFANALEIAGLVVLLLAGLAFLLTVLGVVVHIWLFKRAGL